MQFLHGSLSGAMCAICADLIKMLNVDEEIDVTGQESPLDTNSMTQLSILFICHFYCFHCSSKYIHGVRMRMYEILLLCIELIVPTDNGAVIL